jgi:branched-chain amino acid aminotransferase
MYIWVNGNFTEESKPVLLASDLALLGEGVFDTLLGIDGRIVHGRAHMERLIRHAGLLNINPTYPAKQMLEAMRDTIEKNGICKGYHAIKTLITMGPGNRGLNPPENPSPMCLISISEEADPFIQKDYSVVIARTVRRNEYSVTSRIKSLSYSDNRIARYEARGRGADEALLLNTRGNVACAAAGNLFVKIEGKIYTPPLAEGVTDGITRQIILENGIAEEKSITPEEISHCEAMWVSNSVSGMRPVSDFENRKIDSPSLQVPGLFDTG